MKNEKDKICGIAANDKKIILHTARDLPFGRFLACVTPSACRQAMEPDVKLGRTYSHDLGKASKFSGSPMNRKKEWYTVIILFGARRLPPK
ncbi:MAG: hypothetical protein WC878_01270 [Candidatus Paceibacterota bacterium]|jgi:hypothetical protein